MKIKVLLLLLFIFVSKDGFGQDTSKIYEQWQSNIYQASSYAS